MEKIINIEIPKGYEIDKEKSTFEKIVFKEKKNELPTSWEELGNISGYFIDNNSRLSYTNNHETKPQNKHIFPTKELAEAALALAQLLQLRDKYNGDWIPNWKDDYAPKHTICVGNEEVVCSIYYTWRRTLVFKTQELRDEFFKNFKDLLEIAKPLL